ncbi:hypothetical protein [Paractinoplanes rishiriensis]|uniref:Uncharacterized protein n=1 Tax=Paractinoplanes rishiriensis TaxID=1050105 RepID=A0A919MRN5_9ACTN|nr:hypothetical protein [Actinoplanes rishiriensis]GIE97401.1 hypothetical protein Ari01nite_48660 [Actinoplanes rishiriensis]
MWKRVAPGAVPAGLTFGASRRENAGAATTQSQLADAQGRDFGFALTSSYLNEAQYKSITVDKFKRFATRTP